MLENINNLLTKMYSHIARLDHIMSTRLTSVLTIVFYTNENSGGTFQASQNERCQVYMVQMSHHECCIIPHRSHNVVPKCIIYVIYKKISNGGDLYIQGRIYLNAGYIQNSSFSQKDCPYAKKHLHELSRQKYRKNII